MAPRNGAIPHTAMPAPPSIQDIGMCSSEWMSSTNQLSVEKRWSQEAPVDRARSHTLPGTVYGLRLLPLSAEQAPRQ
jgi:hypothetical protein